MNISLNAKQNLRKVEESLSSYASKKVSAISDLDENSTGLYADKQGNTLRVTFAEDTFTIRTDKGVSTHRYSSLLPDRYMTEKVKKVFDNMNQKRDKKVNMIQFSEAVATLGMDHVEVVLEAMYNKLSPLDRAKMINTLNNLQ